MYVEYVNHSSGFEKKNPNGNYNVLDFFREFNVAVEFIHAVLLKIKFS